MKSFKETQQQKVLRLLKDAGNNGVNSHDLTYIHSIKQAPTRVQELEQKGYKIASIPQENRSVNYILNYEPAELRKPIRYEFVGDKAIPVFG